MHCTFGSASAGRFAVYFQQKECSTKASDLQGIQGFAGCSGKVQDSFRLFMLVLFISECMIYSDKGAGSYRPNGTETAAEPAERPAPDHSVQERIRE